ncbi:MAG: cytidine deaminase [Legionellales bacterium]|nr:cytidine deaminase [Legionellales bacterium]
MSNIDEMFDLAQAAQKNSYCVYSNFAVGCCIKSSQDHLYAGCNYENASFSLTACAETSAIAQMITAGEQEIKEILILGQDHILCFPCGACLQRISEFAEPTTLVHLCQSQGVVKTLKLNELLPYAFGSENLEKSI